MALQKITYADKVALQENAKIADVNKVKASDMNEIKTVFNAMVDTFGTLPKVINNLTSTSTTDALSAFQGKTLLDRLVDLELDFTDMKTDMQNIARTPIGSTILWWGSENALPNGYLPCDGRELQVSVYQDLFNVIGATYGGDGVTTFKLPDLKGRVVVHKDGSTEFQSLNTKGGEKTHTLTVDETPNHNHEIISTGSASSIGYNAQDGIGGYGLIRGRADYYGQTNSNYITSTGGGQAHNNLQPYITGIYIIKTKKEGFTEDLNNLDEQVQILQGYYDEKASLGTTPIGSTIAWWGQTNKVPNGYVLCDGSTLQISEYKELFDIIGTTYGGNGTTTFMLPDLRGRVLVNQNTGTFNALGKKGGEESHTHTTGNHTLTIDEMPKHIHNIYGTSVEKAAGTGGGWSLTHTSSIGDSTSESGGSQPHNHGDTGSSSNLQPYIVTNYIMKAKPTANESSGGTSQSSGVVIKRWEVAS